MTGTVERQKERKFHSFVLLALCDTKHCFTMVDIRAFGGDNYVSVLSN